MGLQVGLRSLCYLWPQRLTDEPFFSLTNPLKKVVRRVIKKGFYRRGSGMIESLSMRGP